MAGATARRTSSKSKGSRRSSNLKVSPNDAELASGSEHWKHKKDGSHHHHKTPPSKQHRHSNRRVSGGRKHRVHPAMQNKDEEVSNGPMPQRKNGYKPNLTVDTNVGQNEHRSPTTPNGMRGSRDLRSPGMPKSPAVAESVPIPDFITQTDANGNATTPRSAQAIESARSTKIKPSLGNKSKSSPKTQKTDAGGDDDHSTSSRDTIGETCDSVMDSFRMMCCCFGSSDLEHSNKSSKRLTSKDTQDSDENVDTKTNENNRPKLLGSIHPHDVGKKCLVLDLDETLVHSSFRAVEGADFVIPVKIEDVVHFVYVAKRPGVDEFLLEMSKHYEIVIYTASLNKYADPLLDLLDIHKVIRYRLFRESCVFYEGNYVKDLSVLDRDIASTIIIDNSPNSYLFHPENAIDCSSFIDDPRDRELDQIGAFLTGIKDAKDVRGLAPQWRDWPVINPIEEVEASQER